MLFAVGISAYLALPCVAYLLCGSLLSASASPDASAICCCSCSAATSACRRRMRRLRRTSASISPSPMICSCRARPTPGATIELGETEEPELEPLAATGVCRDMEAERWLGERDAPKELARGGACAAAGAAGNSWSSACAACITASAAASVGDRTCGALQRGHSSGRWLLCCVANHSRMHSCQQQTDTPACVVNKHDQRS